MRSRTSQWALLALSVALLAAACGGAPEESAVEKTTPVVEGRPLTATGLAGIWLQVEDPSWRLVRFSVARTFAIDDRGHLAETPAAEGTYKVDGDTITFTSEGSDVCTEGDSWAWQASLPEVGRLHIVHTEAAAGQCRIPVGTEWRFVRVSPGSPAGLAANIELTAADTGEGQPPTARWLSGVWLGVEDGLQVRFSPDSTFAIDSGGALTTDPAVLGRYQVDGDTIIFTNETGHACRSGDNWAWRTGIEPDWVMHIVHTDAGTGNCQVDVGTKWVFIRVSATS